MSTIPRTHDRLRELAHRSGDGVAVALLWHELTGELVVTVSDERTGVHFEVPAEPARALDVFEHPYAYAAFGDLPRAETARASATRAAAIR